MANARPSPADTMRVKKKPAPKKQTPMVCEVLENGEQPLNRRTTIYLSETTWKALKLRAVEEETSSSKIIEKLAKEYLNRQ